GPLLRVGEPEVDEAVRNVDGVDFAERHVRARDGHRSARRERRTTADKLREVVDDVARVTEVDPGDDQVRMAEALNEADRVKATADARRHPPGPSRTRGSRPLAPRAAPRGSIHRTSCTCGKCSTRV